MKGLFKQRIALLLSLVLLIVMSMPINVMAQETQKSKTINLLEGAEITVYDANGNIVEHHAPNEKFDIASGVNIPSLGFVEVGVDFWYNGGTMTFYASMSNGRVQDCFIHMVSVSSSRYYSLGDFVAINGNWYGKAVKSSGGVSVYYNAKIYNGNSNMVRLDYLTAIE